MGGLQGKAKVEKYHRRLQKLVQRYTYTDGTYLIRPPVNGHEIVREGQKLHHCVGGYVDRHLNGAHHDPVFAAAGPSGPTAMHHRGRRQYHSADPRLGRRADGLSGQSQQDRPKHAVCGLFGGVAGMAEGREQTR